MSDKIFVGRIKAEEMNGSNGPWVKTSISFNQEDLDKLKSYMNQAGYVNLNLNRSKKGSEYMEINTYQPNQQPQPQQYTAPQNVTPAPVEPPVMPSMDDSDLPF